MASLSNDNSCQFPNGPNIVTSSQDETNSNESSLPFGNLIQWQHESFYFDNYIPYVQKNVRPDGICAAKRNKLKQPKKVKQNQDFSSDTETGNCNISSDTSDGTTTIVSHEIQVQTEGSHIWPILIPVPLFYFFNPDSPQNITTTDEENQENGQP